MKQQEVLNHEEKNFKQCTCHVTLDMNHLLNPINK